MTFIECWGTYAATGPYNNVVMIGSPSATFKGLNLSQAKSAGYGKGIEFSYNSNDNTLKTHINLIGYASDTKMNYLSNQHYVSGNFTYDWYCDYYYSVDNGNSYVKIKSELVASHASTQGLAYVDDWVKSHINHATILSLPQNFTHVKIEVRGDEPAQRHQNIYTREVIITDFKPWAIRKLNTFKSLDRDSGFFKIRKSGNYVDKSKMQQSDTNQENKGTARIRKSGKWVGQIKIGDD